MFQIGDMVKLDEVGINSITIYGIVIMSSNHTIGVKWFNHPSQIPNDDGERYYTPSIANDCFQRVS